MFQAEWEYVARPWLLMDGSTDRFVFLLIFWGVKNQGLLCFPFCLESHKADLRKRHTYSFSAKAFLLPLSASPMLNAALPQLARAPPHLQIKYLLFLSQVDLLSSPAPSLVSVKENPHSSLPAFLNPVYLFPTLAQLESCLISTLGVSEMSSTR